MKILFILVNIHGIINNYNISRILSISVKKLGYLLLKIFNLFIQFSILSNNNFSFISSHLSITKQGNISNILSNDVFVFNTIGIEFKYIAS